MKIVILGTAQDAGVPQVGCECENCIAARGGKGRRYGPCLAFVNDAGTEAILVDASVDFTVQVDDLLKNHITTGISGLKGIILTHAHMGHIWGLGLLGKESVDSKGIEVHCSRPVRNFLRDNYPFTWLISNGNIVLKWFKPEGIDLFGEGKAFPFEVKHRDDAIMTHGLVIEREIKGEKDRTVYIPDMDNINEEIYEKIKDSHVAIIDGTFYSKGELNRDMSEIPHPLIVESIEKLKGLDTTIIFTHMNHSNPVLDPKSKERKHVLGSGMFIAKENAEF